MTATTPTGTRRADDDRPGVSDGSITPSGCEISAAAMSSWPADADTSCAALPGIAPPSRISQRSISGRCSSSSADARRTTATRSLNGVAAHSR